MAKNLVLVESPSKAKTINKYLGRNYVVEATVGHIKNLPKTKLGIDIENGFTPKLMNIRGKADVIKLVVYKKELFETVILDKINDTIEMQECWKNGKSWTKKKLK